MILTVEESTFAQMVIHCLHDVILDIREYVFSIILLEFPIPLECNPVLQQLEEERRQAEQAKEYIGDVSLEDLLEETVSVKQTEEETKLCVGDLRSSGQLKETSQNSNQNFPNNSLQDIDTILNKALDEYEAQLSPVSKELK